MSRRHEAYQAAMRKRAAIERRQFEEDVRAVLGTVSGRRVMLEFVHRLKGNGAPLWRSGAEIHRVAAVHDAGLNIEQELAAIAPGAWRQARAESLMREELTELPAEETEDDGD